MHGPWLASSASKLCFIISVVFLVYYEMLNHFAKRLSLASHKIILRHLAKVSTPVLTHVLPVSSEGQDVPTAQYVGTTAPVVAPKYFPVQSPIFPISFIRGFGDVYDVIEMLSIEDGNVYSDESVAVILGKAIQFLKGQELNEETCKRILPPFAVMASSSEIPSFIVELALPYLGSILSKIPSNLLLELVGSSYELKQSLIEGTEK